MYSSIRLNSGRRECREIDRHGDMKKSGSSSVTSISSVSQSIRRTRSTISFVQRMLVKRSVIRRAKPLRSGVISRSDSTNVAAKVRRSS